MVRAVLWSWPRALFAAVLAIWLPSLLPFVFGPLTGSADCVRAYLEVLPVFPGLVPSFLVGVREGWIFPVAGAITLGFGLCVTWLVRTACYKAFVLVVTALVTGAEALFLGVLLRQ
jgi:hypothetical protein